MWACVNPAVSSKEFRGAYLQDCGPIQPSKLAQDKDKKLREELWKISESQIGEALQKL